MVVMMISTSIARILNLETGEGGRGVGDHQHCSPPRFLSSEGK